MFIVACLMFFKDFDKVDDGTSFGLLLKTTILKIIITNQS